MSGIWVILLLVVSNIFMTFAWYGQLKLSEMNLNKDWPLFLIILFSWGIAFIEYIFMVPANKYGSDINGGPFNLMQLKVMQEAISLTVFILICALVFKSQPIHWNHLISLALLVAAVFFAFLR